MAKIGYLEGTDPGVLHQLAVRDHRLVYLGDVKDNRGFLLCNSTSVKRGKSWDSVSLYDGIDLIIAPYYELKRSYRSSSTSIGGLLESCKKANSRVILIAPIEITANVRREIEEEGVEKGVNLVPPEKLSEKVINHLESKTPEAKKSTEHTHNKNNQKRKLR